MARKLQWDEEQMFTQALLESASDTNDAVEETFMRVMTQKRDSEMEISPELREAFDQLHTAVNF